MATIQDVARACGVSPATVSYVLNNGPRSVRPQTREKVERMIEELQYDPSAVARGLRRKRMDSIGVVFPHRDTGLVGNPYFAAILDGILEVAMESRQNTTLFTGQVWSEGRRSLATYCDGRCDGLLLIAPPREGDMVGALLRKSQAVVLISENYPDLEVSCVDVDNVAAARQLVEYLLDCGHRRIAILSGPENALSAQQRVQGYREALEARRIEVNPDFVVFGHYNEDSGHENTLMLMKRPIRERPTAIFGGNDRVAIGALEALGELGLSAPKDLSVVGFDDMPAAAMTNPPLTTVRQPLRTIGEQAAHILLAQIQNAAPAGQKVIVPTELILRSSAGPPPR